MDIEGVLETIAADLRQLGGSSEARTGSRYIGEGAEPSFVEHVANGGTYSVRERRAPAAGSSIDRRGTDARSGNGLLGVMRKALAEGTSSAGGYLVPVEYSKTIVELIRARSAVMRMGPTIVPVKKELDVTSLASGATAYYVAENAAIPYSEQTFAQTALLRPKDLAALVAISDRLLNDADNPSAEEIIRRDLAEVLALREDLAFLRGSGTAAEPLGIRNTSGLTAAPSLGTNGGTPSFDNLKDVVANLRGLNAPFQRPGWVFHPRTINTLEKVKDSTGRYLADAGLLTFDPTGGGGTLLGMPFATTTQIPVNVTTGTSTDTSEIYFSSDWNDAWVGSNTELEIDFDSSATYTPDGGTTWISSFQNRQTVFRAVVRHDFALRRPQLFSVMAGVRP
jgi:HK97 family phage major capsid protein